jgi:predicted NACHT family NTPase
MPKLELGQALQKLKHLLPNPNCDEWRFRQWWESHRQAWTAQLRTVMIKHCNIGYD